MEDLFYIRKQGAYYGPDNKGYVNDFIRAGIYTREDAQASCDHCEHCSMWPVDVDKHNQEIENRIKDLLRLKICKS